MSYLMFNCKEVTRLVSESLDRKLPIHQRTGIRVHLFMCKFCSRYQQQLMFLRKILSTSAMYDEDTEPYRAVPHEALKRIKRFLHDNLDKSE
jgi:hypothetical protein